MKDLLEKIIAFVPAYISDFVGLLTGPKRFVAECVSEKE
jgi:hypothetical protein